MLIEDIRETLRISNSAFDTEITDLINTARQDLIIAGITTTKANDDTDALIKRAITIYCKANFGFDNPDAERLQKSYEMLKLSLALAEDYITEVVVV